MAHYDGYARVFENHASGGAYNALYDRPAVLGLVGDIDGLTVLDAGCGPGLYAEELLARGAQVMGCDQSAEMIELARARLGDRATLRVHDLDEPLEWLPDDAVDLVVMALVMHHLSDARATLTELHRVLRPGGAAVISTVHPLVDWRNHGGSYFADEWVSEDWIEGWNIQVRRAPLSAWCADIAAAGFVITDLVEPQPVPQMREEFPDDYRQLSTAPGFVVFRLTPR